MGLIIYVFIIGFNIRTFEKLQ